MHVPPTQDESCPKPLRVRLENSKTVHFAKAYCLFINLVIIYKPPRSLTKALNKCKTVFLFNIIKEGAGQASICCEFHSLGAFTERTLIPCCHSLYFRPQNKAEFSNAHSIGTALITEVSRLLLPIQTEPYLLQLSINLFGKYHPLYTAPPLFLNVFYKIIYIKKQGINVPLLGMLAVDAKDSNVVERFLQQKLANRWK